MSDGDDIRPLLGSYTLGGLEPGEARRVEEHLRTCADCRAVHAELAGLPALMDLVTDPERAPERPGRATERAVLQSYRAQHRSRRRPARRWVLGGAAAALAAAAGVAAVLVLGGSGTQDADMQRKALMPMPGAEGSGMVELRGDPAGTRVDLDVALPATASGQLYEVWLSDGPRYMSAGSFRMERAGRTRVRLVGAAPMRPGERVMITREPDDGDAAMNGPAILETT